MATFLPFAGPYLNMGPITKAPVSVIQFGLWVNKVRNSWIFNFLWQAGTWIHSYHTLTECFWGYFNNSTCCEEMTPGEIFSQPFNHLFGSALPVFEGFRSSLNTNDIIQWLVLLIGLFCLAFRDKGRLTWITTLTPTPKTQDAAPEPDPAPQPTSAINYPDWMGVLVKEIHEMSQMLKDHISQAHEKPSQCLEEGQSNSAAAEPTDVTTVQVPAEPQRQSQPAAVAPVETRRSKMKSEHPDKGRPSQPSGDPEIEIVTESLMYDNHQNLHKDIVQWKCEAYTTWLLWVWDLISTGVQPDGGEARNLGPLTQDSGINQIFVREPGSLSL